MEFRCLGPLHVAEGDHAIPLGGPKQRLLLAHLIRRANQPVQATQLIDEIWGDDPPRAVRASLQSYVSHLRRALGTNRIESHGQGYLLRVDPGELDLMRLTELVADGRAHLDEDPEGAVRTLRTALGLWNGLPFGDLADEPSLQPEITRLEELRISVEEDRIGAELALGRQTQLVEELELLTSAHPLRERLWAQLMLALYRAERPGDALAAFERARRVLSEELGLDPSPELKRLHEQVLNQDRALELPTRTLRGYRLLERLGEGSAGVVHRAIQPHLGREVAIEVIPADLANQAEFIRRFDTAAQAVASLEHPHVVPLYDYWREPNGAYLVTRLLHGGSLRDVLARDGPPEPDAARRIGEQVTEALAAAHVRGVVHRRVGPSQVLLDEAGNAFLSGFAIVADVDGERRPAPPGDPRYRAPELGPSDLPDTVGDVYSLGMLLTDLFVAVPDDWQEAIERATARQPGKRFPDAGSVLAAMRRQTPPGTAAGTLATQPRTVALGANPYKGLRPFSGADSLDFFGREVLVSRLVTRLRDEGSAGRMLAVVGPSGSGKSSVVRAGLVPALRAGALPGSDRWFVVEMSPGSDPFHELEAALVQVAVEPLASSIASRLEDDPGALVEVAEDVLPELAGHLLVVIDQFEELFTLVDEEDRRQRFVAALVRAVNTPGSRVRVVITMRADLYDRPLRYGGLAELLRTRTEVIVPLTVEELERAVRAPAERVGVDVEADLLSRIVADVTDQPGALPLLQYALTLLFERRRSGALSRASYDEIGGVAGALARHAEEVFAALPDAGREAARQLFLRLVNLGEAGEDTGRRASRTELDSLEADRDELVSAIETFGAARLLSFDRDPSTRAATVEVAHESLLWEWGRLRTWIAVARDDLSTERRLAAAARDWIAANREPSYLLSGARLEQLEAWRASSGLAVSAEERDLVDSSIAQRERDRADEDARRAREQAVERLSYRRLHSLVAVLLVATLVASALSVFGFAQWDRAHQEASIATVRELAASAVATLEVDPELSVLLALEAVERSRAAEDAALPEAEEALHRAVGESRIVLNVPDVGGSLDWSSGEDVFVTEGPEDSGVIDIRDATTGASVRSWHGHDIDVNDVAFSADGSKLVSVGDDGASRAWDTATGEQLWAVEGEDAAWQPAWSPDGQVVAATWPAEQMVRLIDAASGEPIRELDVLPFPFATGFDPDSDLLAVSEFESAVHLYGVDDGREQAVLDHEFVNAVAWSPDGTWIATASADATVRFWDAQTFEPRFTLYGHRDGLNDIAWSPDSTRLVTGSADGTAKVWDITGQGGRESTSLSARDLHGVHGVAFSPDGDRVMVGDTMVTGVQIWNVGLRGDKEWATFPAQPVAWNATVFSQDGDQLVASSDRPGTATVWDIASGEEQHTVGNHDDTVTAIAVAPNDGRIATGGGTNAVVSDPRTGERIFEYAADDAVTDVAWDPDGARLAVSTAQGPIRVLDAAGEPVASLPWGGGYGVHRVQFAPDGRLVGAVRSSARFVPEEPQVRLWDWRREEAVLTIDTYADALAFDPTDATIATASPDGDIALWDLASGERIRTLSGHQGHVASIAFNPDGSRLVSGGSDATVRVWDPGTGAQRLVLDGHDGLVFRVAFSPEGSRIASSDAQGIVRVWAHDLDDLIGIASAQLTRELTDEECRQYLPRGSCA
jgi:WD40 repeat protein/DNA-binding SARP family transcriptional activator